MSKASIYLGILICALSLFSCGLRAEEEGNGGVKKYGVTYDIAEDREVVKVGGVYGPEGLDRYMKRKFDSMIQKLTELGEKIDKIESRTQEMQSTVQQLVRKVNDAH